MLVKIQVLEAVRKGRVGVSVQDQNYFFFTVKAQGTDSFFLINLRYCL